MTINRLNYEKYAIDYLDGTLSPDLREEMVTFLNAHPDIREEVEWQQQFTAPALKVVSHPDKSRLLKPEGVTRRIRPIYWLAAAASVALLIVFGLFWRPQPDNHPMAAGEEKIMPASESHNDHPIVSQDPNQQLAAVQQSPEELTRSSEASEAERSKEGKHQILPAAEPKSRNSTIQVARHAPATSGVPATTDINKPVATDRADDQVAVLETSPASDEAIALTEAATREMAFIALPAPVVTLLYDEETNPIAESAVALSAQVSQPEERNRLNILKRMLRPEAYTEDGSFSIRESVIPEAFAGLFSKD
ncbi:MAG: hypothetical protein KDC28_01190 [Saprospiraceae bacterium]|nr:hypothetical protein [Saprospiraceae bacterium]MCB9322051.1 hypothetical protein [Lewinellaceae bacterium]